MRLVLLLFAFLSASLPSAALALGPKEEAERTRLRDEMADLAARNAWKGVDRQYAQMVDKELEPTIVDHLLGAQAATNLGDMVVAVERLEAAVGKELAEGASEDDKAAHETAKKTLDGILERYGKVEIKIGNSRLPGLIRFDNPFGTEERSTIQRAREILLDKREYRGLLPLGGYMVDGDKFEVARFDGWQSFVIE